METGTKVILTQEYNGHPVGTIGLYMYGRRDSGTWCAVIALEDDRYFNELKAYGFTTLKEMVDRNQNMPEMLECSLTTFRPTHQMIAELEDLEKEIENHKKQLKEKLVLASKLRKDSTPNSDLYGGNNFDRAIKLAQGVFAKYKIRTPMYHDRNNLEICLLEHDDKDYSEQLTQDLFNIKRDNNIGTVEIGIQRDSSDRNLDNLII